MINKARTVETWFDNYKEHVYNGDPNLRNFRTLTGNITARLALKQKLNCKPFSYFVQRFHDVFRKRGMLDEDLFVIRDMKSGLCVQMKADKYFMVSCDKRDIHQRFSGEGGALRLGSVCLDSDAKIPVRERFGKAVLAYHCQDEIKGVPDTQKFRLTKDGRIRMYTGNIGNSNHADERSSNNLLISKDEDYCITVDSRDSKLIFSECSLSSEHQFVPENIKMSR
jgi:hypothetical protein